MSNVEIIPIDEDSLYGITKDGRIWSFPLVNDKYNKHNGMWISLSNDKDGYKIAYLQKLRAKQNKRVHRLVAEAFIPNPNNLPMVNHIDGVKSNNSIDNLEWVNAIGNAKHAIKKGLSSRGTMQKRNTSGFVGIKKNHSSWTALITVDSKVITIGTFKDKIEAAKAYDSASIKYHGNTGKLNFPNKNR